MYIENNTIKDDEGRTLILRGVNLGGDSKYPFCAPGCERESAFLKTDTPVSFIGRPFRLEDAESHFKRLKNAGMTFIRFLVTWEALEHEGPGIYDEAYLAWLRKILLSAEKEGISVFIDPHQDVWSRWTGGDGAPAWTMEKLGMNPDALDRSGAAITRQRYSLYHRGKKHPDGDPFPKMIWPSNYNRYAAATMFTLFFAGNTYAPQFQIEGENVQDYLQNHYIAAFRHARRRLKNCGAIEGWGVINEPHYGYIGHRNIEQMGEHLIPIGPRPSPWQSICAASGYSVKVPVYSMNSFGKHIKDHEIFNPEGVSIFKDGYSCPWKQAGVWTDEGGAPKLLNKEHFSLCQGRRPVFTDDFLKPFIVKYINAMKEADERKFFFIEGPPDSTAEESHPSWGADDPSNIINAFHWYDGFALFTKSFRPWFTIDTGNFKFIFGRKNTAAFFRSCLAKGLEVSKKRMGETPCLLGEFGLAFDMNKRRAFKTGNYSAHEEALSMYYDAADANMLHSTIWNYTASNTNKYGDGWNDEDLSIFSEGRERAAAGWKRPYPMAVAGKPIMYKWDKKKKIFTFRFIADSKIEAPSIIYLPADTFGPSPAVETSSQQLSREYDYTRQALIVYNKGYNGEAEINVR
ncbi:MAG: cellulase family glycosylhydrolase [Treponema sp.]|jgi:hypothetical protein|nr:cellulase family glycosylhydrolase [Treponema sp.]